MTDTTAIAAKIQGHHRRRRFAMKMQQKIDRGLEQFIRNNYTDWSPDLEKKERDRINAEVKTIVDAARKGEGEPEVINLVQINDASRAPYDTIRAAAEKNMEALARELPVFPWVKAIYGARELGLATIIAEAGDLSRYPNPAKLWKRLGYAPYDGYAGSTWKRESWSPRRLTAKEWIANPFSGERYALMRQISESLVNAQWIGAAKTDTGEGKPDGPYGEIYAKRREHTAKTHPDWTKAHSRADALRIAMKAYLCDLWAEWKRVGHPKRETHPTAADPTASHLHLDNQEESARRSHIADQGLAENQSLFVGKAVNQGTADIQARSVHRKKCNGHLVSDTHPSSAVTAGAARRSMKPTKSLPRRQPSKEKHERTRT
jgi:hypothetical protein